MCGLDSAPRHALGPICGNRSRDPRASSCLCLCYHCRVCAGNVRLVAENLHAVGGEKLKGGTLQEWGCEGLARVACVHVGIWVGEDQFGAYLIGPVAAEDLVAVRDDWVARV